jgi:hypothetical protein
MKKAANRQPEKNPAISQEFPARLAALESELRLYPSRPAGDRPLKSVKNPEETLIGQEKVVQFLLLKNSYAAGHSDVTYSGSNHARGVRHIRFYAEGKAVLDIEGDYEDQQFGSNFRFQNVDVYLPGDWEAPFLKLTDELIQYKSDRREAFKTKRAAEQARRFRHER